MTPSREQLSFVGADVREPAPGADDRDPAMPHRKETVKQRRVSSVLPATVISLLLLVSAACTTAPKAETAADAPVITQGAGSAGLLALPLDAYELPDEDYLQVQRATMHSLRDCMASFGLTLSVPEVSASRYPRHATALGWLGAHEVERYGYRGPANFADDMAAAARRGSRPIVVPEDQIAVFEGSVPRFRGETVPEGGCDGKTRRTLNGGEVSIPIDGLDSTVPPERWLHVLGAQAGDRARSDARFSSTVRSWSECMRDRGFRYQNPDQAMSDPRWSTGEDGAGQSPSRDEIETAVADRDCRDRANFSGVAKFLMAQYENEMINSQGHRIREVSDLLKTRAMNSSRILSAR
ncbi:hypothetical protein ACIGZJ_31935 [Kitasatospora sp. NPDC052868]|uniref:hypothetical protein n=1 Tax=Kitasatospora sp. NPDC052868 TaxID=3364060 RepID=UPI0037C8D59D